MQIVRLVTEDSRGSEWGIKRVRLNGEILAHFTPDFREYLLLFSAQFFVAHAVCFRIILKLYKHHNIVIMSQYLNEFANPSISGMSKPSQGLQHYRIEIRKLQQKLKQTANDYEKRINQLQNEIKHHRKPIFQSGPTAKPTADLNFQIYQRDNTIKELKNQNTKLRQVINNPDHILIKKQNNFEVITEKDNQISRLKKALLQIESKYDGQFFNEHKVKKEYEMLLKENEALKQHIRNLEMQRRGVSEADSNEALEIINYKKQLEVANRENEVLKKVILDQEQAYKNNARVSQRPVDPNTNRRVSSFAFNTQLEDMKLEVEEYKAKNRELTKKVKDLSKENEKLLEQRERNKRLPSRQSRNVESGRLSRIREGPQQEEEMIQSYKNREVIRASFVEEPHKSEQTPKKSGKYSELGIDESIANRLSKALEPL